MKRAGLLYSGPNSSNADDTCRLDTATSKWLVVVAIEACEPTSAAFVLTILAVIG
jgi:hypothetical protein